MTGTVMRMDGCGRSCVAWLRRHAVRPRREDEGSATLVGAALVVAAAVLIGVLAAAGNIVLRQSQARTAADMAALGAASALWRGDGTPCAVAAWLSDANAGNLQRCDVDGDDVSVSVHVPTDVPFVDHVTADARAGPRPCAN
ncbi:Rv3654c family TadE-like protein [Bifidobacterium castoris]|nr:Rv3654c family TadE-like protein [Bifidobacterium castoris]MDE5640528.1 flp pilus-assembly TadE/G-like family protein [Bifidobacterium castoris]